MPYTILRGTAEYQSKVWDSFTEQEKTEFAAGTASVALRAAQRTVELGLEDSEVQLAQLDQHIYEEMTRLANEWETGDYVGTAEAYGAGTGEIIGSVAIPIALTQLAKTPRAAAALARAQEAVNVRMMPLLDTARDIRYVEDALPLLRALENGAELNADAMRALAGITPEEVGELQALAAKYDMLLTVRSRHQSSMQWIQKFGAMLKPEAIKVKSVSELDVKLGYNEGDLGSVIFKKPQPMKQVEASGSDLETAVHNFVRGRGFADGTPEFDDAVKRMDLRIEEWRKHESAYKEYARRKSIRTEFDYEGNAIPDLRSPSSRNKTTGFQLDEVGDEEYIVRLLDPKDGRYKRVTGDIDPIAFTNLDGSPLSSARHKELMDAMRASARLRAQHPESATYVRGGADFILGQFKPGEPGFQIGPTGPARVVRLDTSKSRWANSRDYHLHWEGGYVHAGGRGQVTAAPAVRPDFDRDVDVEVPTNIKPKPMDLGRPGEATYGRCEVTVGSSTTAPAIFLDETGQAVEASQDGTVGPSDAAAQCLIEGPPITLESGPTAVVESSSGPSPAALAGGGGVLSSPAFFTAAADEGLATTVSTGTSVRVVLAEGQGSPELFAAGQQVLLGAQRPSPELVEVASVDGTTLTFARPVGVEVDDVVAMVVPAPVSGGSDGSGVGSSGGGVPAPHADDGEGGDPEPAAACPSGLPPAGFVDVPPSSTHAGAISCLAEWGLVNGTTADRFDPARR